MRLPGINFCLDAREFGQLEFDTIVESDIVAAKQANLKHAGGLRAVGQSEGLFRSGKQRGVCTRHRHTAIVETNLERPGLRRVVLDGNQNVPHAQVFEAAAHTGPANPKIVQGRIGHQKPQVLRNLADLRCPARKPGRTGINDFAGNAAGTPLQAGGKLECLFNPRAARTRLQSLNGFDGLGAFCLE